MDSTVEALCDKYENVSEARYYFPLGDFTEEDYDNLSPDQRVEVINGVVYNMASPNIRHARLSRRLARVIEDYIAEKGGDCEVFTAPVDVKLDADTLKGFTTVVPDLFVVCDPSKIDDKRCNGAPDWVIEIISPGNARHDLAYKLTLYIDAGVREYWIVDPRRDTVLVYYLEQDSDDVVQMYTFKDTVKVNIYDDFSIDFNELNV